MALFSMRGVRLGFGGPLVLENIDLQIERGERLGLLGRNGAGKSTLLKLITGELAPDEGVLLRQQGLRIAYLPQEAPVGLAGAVVDVVAAGLDEGAATSAPDDAEAAWQRQRRLDTIFTRMQLEPNAEFAALSAGLKRRVLLARGLVSDPDIILLDEPTNHLDIEAISWLEEFLLRYAGTLVFVTHDRAFLSKLATRIIEIDRARLIDWQTDYDTFVQRKQAVLDAELRQEAEFDRKLAQEESWIRQGIEARRTRNEGRVRALDQLRLMRRERRERPGALRIQLQEAERSGRLVLEAKDVSFSYAGQPVVSAFSLVILRGDRVGIIGPNGSGKTTLLRLLLGELAPQGGRMRHGAGLEIAYFDQLRAQIDPERTAMANVADGSEFITVNGRRRHLIGYLQEFLFTPERARVYAGTLSGGERNRLLLARLFARPSNLLVLDEPTNDLDLETLEVLESLLMAYEGTVILVSHDRSLLNNVVTSTLALEAGGRVVESAGGYDDYLRQRTAGAALRDAPPPAGAMPARPAAGPTPLGAARPRKLSYREQRELEALPVRIEALEAEQARLYANLADPTLYQRGGQDVSQAQARLAEVEAELAGVYARWEELEG